MTNVARQNSFLLVFFWLMLTSVAVPARSLAPLVENHAQKICLGNVGFIKDHLWTGGGETPYFSVNSIVYPLDRLPARYDWRRRYFNGIEEKGLYIQPVKAWDEGVRTQISHGFEDEEKGPVVSLSIIPSLPLPARGDLHCSSKDPVKRIIFSPATFQHLTMMPGQLKSIDQNALPGSCGNFDSGIYINSQSALEALVALLPTLYRRSVLVLIEGREQPYIARQSFISANDSNIVYVSVTTTEDAAGSAGSAWGLTELILSDSQTPATIKAVGPELSNRNVFHCHGGGCTLHGLRITMGDYTGIAPPRALLSGKKSFGRVYYSELLATQGTLAATGDRKSIIYIDNLFSGEVRNVCRIQCAKVRCFDQQACFSNAPGCYGKQPDKRNLRCRRPATTESAVPNLTQWLTTMTEVGAVTSDGVTRLQVQTESATSESTAAIQTTGYAEDQTTVSITKEAHKFIQAASGGSEITAATILTGLFSFLSTYALMK